MACVCHSAKDSTITAYQNRGRAKGTMPLVDRRPTRRKKGAEVWPDSHTYCHRPRPPSVTLRHLVGIFFIFLQLATLVLAAKHHTAGTVDRRYELQILRRLLAAGYTYYARPLTVDNGTLEARIRVSLIKIQNLWERTDVKTEALEVTMRIQLNWCDGALAWEADSFGGVDYVIIPGDRLWIPDIQIINALDDVYALIRDRRFDFKLHSDGCVWWFPTGTIFTRCELDLSYFPFDEQNCPIIFESAMYPKEFLNLTVRYDKSAVSLKTFKESGQWDLVTAYAVPRLNYVTSSTAFSRVEVTLKIRRKTLYYKINAFFPCGMLSALQILTFFLPIGSEDRISQSTTILLSVIVFQSIVVGELPRTSNSVPLLCIYIDFLTGISVLTIADAILGVYVLSSSNRHGCFAKILQGFNFMIDQNKKSRARRRQSQPGVELLTRPSRTPGGKSNLVVSAVINNADAEAFEEDSLDAASRYGPSTGNLNLVGLPAGNHAAQRHDGYGAVVTSPTREERPATNGRRKHWPAKKHETYDNIDDASSTALRTAAICIDNIVFLISMTSSIAVPIYMFIILPPNRSS